MRLLVVGGGSIGKRHLGNFKQLGVTHLGVVDVRDDRRQEVQEKIGVQKAYADLGLALRDGYDAVLVGVPTAFHTDVARASIAAGAHVLVEKPISHTEAGLMDLLAEAKKKRLVFMVGYTYRFWAPLVQLRQLLNDGAIGKVYFADITFSEYLPDWHPWEDYRAWFMSKKEQGGGALFDESHAVDMARWLFGEIADVSCLTGNISHLEMTADDHAQLLVNYASGARGTIHMDLFGRKHRRSIEIIGEKGNLSWDFFANRIELVNLESRVTQTFAFSCERNDMFLAEARHFLACIEGRGEPEVSGEDALRTLTVLLAAIKSSETGQRVACR